MHRSAITRSYHWLSRRRGGRMRTVLVLIACIGLAACYNNKPSAEDLKVARELEQKRVKKEADVALAISKPLSPRMLQAGVHELVVLDVPSSAGMELIEKQRCYVWRDAEFKTATISCPSGAKDFDFSHEYSGTDSVTDEEPARLGR